MEEVKKLYLSRFVYGIGVLSTFTFTLYFLSHGLTQTQISLLYSVYFIATAIFQIPTGGFADTFGHKASYALGFMIEAFYYLIFFLFPNFWGIFVGMLIAALGVSFQSGANNSLTYEILNKIGKADDFVKVNSRIGAFGDFAVILAAPLGLYIYKYNQGLPYLISFILVLVAGLLASLVKFEFTATPKTVRYLIDQMKIGTRLTLKSSRLVFLYLVGTMTLISSYVITENVSAPFQVQLGIDVGAIGFTQSLISIGFIVVGLVGYRFFNKFGGVSSLLSSVFFAVASLLVLSQVHAFWGAGLIVLFMIFHSFRCQVLGGLEQNEFTSAQRTTMASAGTMLSTVIAALVMPLWGLSIDRTGIRMTLVFLAAFMLVLGTFGTIAYAKAKSKTV